MPRLAPPLSRKEQDSTRSARRCGVRSGKPSAVDFSPIASTWEDCREIRLARFAHVAVSTHIVGAPAAADDKKLMEGTWLPVTAEMAGEKYPDQILKSMKLIIKGESYTVLVGKQTDEGTTKLDPEKTPKQLDIKGTKGPNEGKTILAIYELKEDTLRVCYDLGGEQRPAEFMTKPDTKLFLVTYSAPSLERVRRVPLRRRRPRPHTQNW